MTRHPLLPRRAWPWLLAAALLAGCASAPAPRDATTLSLRIIAFNDFHGHLEADGQALSLANPAHPGQRLRVAVGGADALAGTVAALRAGAPDSVLISSGDLVGAAPLVSTLFRHESTIEVMNQMGVDLGIPGNHEFDAGEAELQRLLAGGCAATPPGSPAQSCAQHGYAGAHFPLIAANISRHGSALFAPTWVRQVGPVRVGFIGAITRTTPSIVLPSGIRDLAFGDEAEAINRAAAELQAQGVQALVAVVHEGGELAQTGAEWNDERCPGWQGALAEIERRITPAVDVILSAHTHQGYRCKLGDRIVMQATSYGRGVSVVDMQLDARTGRVDRAASRSRNLPVLNAQTDPAVREQLLAAEPAPFGDALRLARPDAATAHTVAAYTALAAPRANQTVGRLGGPVDRSGRTDSAAGRLIADAQLAATRAPEAGGAELALMNAGGIRADLPCRGAAPCAVSFGDVFTAQPFGNGLVVMTLSGADLRALLESQQPAGHERPKLLAPSAGLSYRWLASAAPGQHVQDLRLNGRAVQPGQRLRITVNSFLAEGGDGYTLLKTYGERVAGPQDIDALLAHVRGNPAPDPVARITWVD
jgi:5'-nucleotidase